MSKRKAKSLKPAASLSGSLLKTGGAPRNDGGPGVQARAHPPPAGPPSADGPFADPEARPAPRPLSEDLRPRPDPIARRREPPAEAPEAPKPVVSGLEADAFDGLIPGLLKSEAEPPPAKKSSDQAPPRLLDQFECLQSRNQELAVKGADRSKTARANFLRNLRSGLFADAEIDFARIMTLEPQVARRVLYKAEIEDLAVIFRAIGFRSLEFATIIALLRGAKGTRGLSAPDQLKASLGIFETIDRDCAMELLEHIPDLPRRNWSALRGA